MPPLLKHFDIWSINSFSIPNNVTENFDLETLRAEIREYLRSQRRGIDFKFSQTFPSYSNPNTIDISFSVYLMPDENISIQQIINNHNPPKEIDPSDVLEIDPSDVIELEVHPVDIEIGQIITIDNNSQGTISFTFKENKKKYKCSKGHKFESQPYTFGYSDGSGGFNDAEKICPMCFKELILYFCGTVKEDIDDTNNETKNTEELLEMWGDKHNLPSRVMRIKG